MRALASEAFLRYLWQDDTRTEAALSPALVPYLGFHKAIVDEVTYHGARVLCGAAVDGCVLARVGGPAQCECHARLATRALCGAAVDGHVLARVDRPAQCECHARLATRACDFFLQSSPLAN